MKSKHIWAVLAIIISYLVVFSVGAVLGGKISKKYLTEYFHRENAPIDFVHYKIFRDIARNIHSGNYQLAECNAELGASSNFDDLKKCMLNDTCRPIIASDVRNKTPEVLTGKGLGFDYLSSIDGIRRCEEKTMGSASIDP